MPTNNQEKWEEKLKHVYNLVQNCPFKVLEKIIGDFIFQEIRQAYQQGWKDRENNPTPDESIKPMGVSQWAEYGKRLGYWGYFIRQEIRQAKIEERKELIKKIELLWMENAGKKGSENIASISKFIISNLKNNDQPTKN